MKKIFLLLPSLFVLQFALVAQCGSGTCPTGSINTLPAGGTIAAGTTYCITGPISNTSDYIVNGTLIIQSGSVTVGNLTVGKTGSISVNPGSRFMANSYTGEATAPASAISNVSVCPYGYLYLSGAINPGETNFTVNDNGMFVIHGSWSTIIGDTYFKLGMGSIVEMCSSFMFKSSTGFFTETSTGTSYVVTRSAMANGAGGGYLSKLGAASQINWDIPGGPVAWVTHPSANTCTGSSCTPMLPPGSVDDGICGSVANSFPFVLLPLHFLAVEERLSGENLLITAALGEGFTAERMLLEGSADGLHFRPTVYAASVGTDNRYHFILPAAADWNYYRIKAMGNKGSVTSNVLSALANASSTGTAQPRIFPNPASNFIYVANAQHDKTVSAELVNCMGQVVRRMALPPGIPVVRWELPVSLPAGMYLIRLKGIRNMQTMVRVQKTQ